VLAATDFIVIPMQMSGYAVKGLKETLRSVHHVRQELNPDLRVLGLLPTFVVMRTRFSRDLLDGLRAIPNLRVFNTVIKVTVRLQESALAGEPVTVMAPSSEAAAAYRSFADEVLAALIAEGERGV
jgi:chromosome partitioning protein